MKIKKGAIFLLAHTCNCITSLLMWTEAGIERAQRWNGFGAATVVQVTASSKASLKRLSRGVQE